MINSIQTGMLLRNTAKSYLFSYFVRKDRKLSNENTANAIRIIFSIITAIFCALLFISNHPTPQVQMCMDADSRISIIRINVICIANIIAHRMK